MPIIELPALPFTHDILSLWPNSQEFLETLPRQSLSRFLSRFGGILAFVKAGAFCFAKCFDTSWNKTLETGKSLAHT